MFLKLEFARRNLDYRSFFVNLQVMMKNVLIKVAAVLLVVWYSMSIIGFDVHTCSGSGRSFVASFIEGLTCEDIHPEHSCCSHSHHDEDCDTDHSDCIFCDGTSFKAQSCCSNDYQVLALTGTVSSDDHRHYDECSCGHCPCLEFPSDMIQQPDHSLLLLSYLHKPDSGLPAAGDRQAALSIWRI
jgi:hypothetical protein